MRAPPTLLLVCLGTALSAPPARAQLGGQQYARVFPAPNDLAVGNGFGSALALEGATLAIGAPQHAGSGIVYTFDLLGGAAVQSGKLASSTLDVGDRLGTSLALDAGNLVVGASFDEVGPTAAAGSVFVYQRPGGSWVEVARLTAGDLAQNDHFGSAVAIVGDTLVVGAPEDDLPGAADAGSAYVFVFAAGAWTQQAKLMAGDAQFADRFGASLGISGDTVVVGAPGEDGLAGASTGAAYVFERAGNVWSEVLKLEASDPDPGAEFGHAVALDLDTLVVGAPYHDGQVTNQGAAYVFFDDGVAWSQEAKLTDFGTPFVDRFGTSVDVEGDRLVVGLPYNAVGGLATGSVQLFTRSAGHWTGELELIGSESDPNDFLGTSAALSGDLIAGGARTGETPPTDLPTGEAYVFEIVPPPVIDLYCTGKTNSLGCVPVMGWTGAPSASNPTPFELTCTEVLNFKSGLLFYGYSPAAAPFQGGTRCVTSPLQRTPIQNSLGTTPPASDCTGSFHFDMNARIQSGRDPLLAVGADGYAQYWMRDPASPSTTGLSDAVHFLIAP